LSAGIADDEIPFFVEVTAGGRITIPEEIRKIFQIKDGDAVFCRLRIMPKRKNDSVAEEAKQPSNLADLSLMRRA
jgi:bifunctional DNA-binding transcriptional regulator/antitoxin component of YhaV-PrlF toxin-antitoxin module